MIRVLIVDEQNEVRKGLRMRLSIEPDMTVVGEAGHVEEALALAQTLTPTVIVVDIEMRDADGVNIVERLRAAAPTAAGVVLILRSDETTRTRAQQAGAAAFLEKSGGAADLLQAIRQVGACRFAQLGSADWPVGNVTAKRGPSLERKSDTRV
jgi:DNA-binding NarL/FixJ family response regulator